jgi:hypothetical protein
MVTLAPSTEQVSPRMYQVTCTRADDLNSKIYSVTLMKDTP